MSVVEERGRLTLPDLMIILMAVAAIGAIWPIYRTLLNNSVVHLNRGEAMLYSLFLPFMLLVVLAKIYEIAAGRPT